MRGKKTPGPRQVGLVWPILLVVAPVVVLSVAALYSLREDRAAIDNEARNTARLLAENLARDWSASADAQLTTQVASACSDAGPDAQADAARPTPAPFCGLIVEGRVRVPLGYPAVPSPPPWLLNLAPAQTRAWRFVADASPRTDPVALRRAAASLAAASPDVRINAEWAVARSDVNRDPSPKDTARLADLARRSEGVLSESGTPVGDLAVLLALRHLPAGDLPDVLLRDLRQRVVESPSFLTKALLDEAARAAPGSRRVAALAARWTAQSRALALLGRMPPPDPGRPAEVWLDDDGRAWLALVHPLLAGAASSARARTAFQLTLLPASLVERTFTAALTGRDDIPGYARIRVRLGGRTWSVGGAAAGSTPPVELASAAGQIDLPLMVPAGAGSRLAGELLRVADQAIPVRQGTPGVMRLNGSAGGHAFTVILELAAPEVLYASYRARWWVAVGFVLTATLAALVGLAVTWRAFDRQRRLAAMKSNFVASVSHELRAPIAAVRLMAESLERGTIEAGERRQEYLRVMGRECRRLSSLVANVLDFSRIERGRRQYTFEATDLAPLVAQTVDVMRPYAAERRVSIVCDPPTPGGAAWQARVDREAIQQALVNLVDNAIKHSPAGADVVVGLEAEPDAGGHDRAVPARIRLLVEDRGPGIPADEQARIFEPFYRRGSELRRETPGVGIGLSIVKHIAEAHGGRVVVRSSPGAGSRFAVELPCDGPQEPAPGTKDQEPGTS